mmetsp:Transcript_18668/g.64805  ORF Transcript_18668/g.64805 Transcript_18668/m.64805 type:complete len:239 (+) Transcript_18668:872-1588(+)
MPAVNCATDLTPHDGFINSLMWAQSSSSGFTAPKVPFSTERRVVLAIFVRPWRSTWTRSGSTDVTSAQTRTSYLRPKISDTSSTKFWKTTLRRAQYLRCGTSRTDPSSHSPLFMFLAIHARNAPSLARSAAWSRRARCMPRDWWRPAARRDWGLTIHADDSRPSRSWRNFWISPRSLARRGTSRARSRAFSRASKRSWRQSTTSSPLTSKLTSRPRPARRGHSAARRRPDSTSSTQSR